MPVKNADIVRVYLFIILLVSNLNVSAQLYLDNKYSAKYLVENILLAGDQSVKVENVIYRGSPNSIAYFESSCQSIDLKEGILLTTGHYLNIGTPNRYGNSGTSNFLPGDPQLKRIANGPAYDATILEFDFYPNADSVSFNFFFGSEEYPEFVDKGVNDVFAFFISGPGIDGVKNLAVLPETQIPVSVDNINFRRNANYYIENKLWIPKNYEYFKYNQWAGELAYSYTLDGFTTILTAKTKVEPMMKYHIKIAIADVGDDIYDSGVFLEAGSFQSYGKIKWMETFTSRLTEELIEVPGIKISSDSTEVMITADINFLFDSYEIPGESYNLLNSLVKLMNKYPTQRIQINGHTDDLGSDDYNNELSFKRAEVIANYLNQYGVSKFRINYKGFGNSKPIATNITTEGRSKNRRVEFIFLNE